ncbi:MAG: PAS domain-containing sensor histidine kinase [Acidobacteria bacterium]|nr:PAS domain-containing sensor histidine kinase [Acidobacteriota bacterium]
MFGLLWIAVNGAIVDRLFDNPDQIVGFELLKGIVFVLVSTALLYLFITRHARRVLESEMESESKLSMMVDQLPAILWTIDSDLIIDSITGSGLRLLGPAANQSLGRNATDLVPRFAADVLEKAVRGTPGTYVIEFEDRILRTWVEPMRSDGDLVGAIALSIDITEQEAVRRNLEASMRALWRVQDELVEKSRALERSSAQLIDAQESERERIARELHDELGGIFTSLSFDVALIGENAADPALVTERSSEMLRRIDGAMKRVREIAHDLRPKVLDDFGLVAAIEDLVAAFSDRYGIETNLSSRPEEITVGRGYDIMLYRIVQEALTNVVKHAAATRAEVRLRLSDHHVVAEIRDDGRGIRPEEMDATGSLGLVGMRERADILGGDLAIEPFAGKGTIVRVKVPLSRREQS